MSALIVHPRRALIAAFAILATAVALFAATDRADAAATKCPGTFHVQHNDHIGKLNLPEGQYVITTKNVNQISCQRASDLFTKFLQDYDGKLPNGWKVLVNRSGFRKSPQKAFFVKRQGGGGGGGGGGDRHPGRGEKICPGTFQVQHDDHIGKLKLPKGPYKITTINRQPEGGAINCSRASQLFAEFLQYPMGNLPSGWKLEVQSATFKKAGKHKGFRVKQA
jgi:hypothetical protein